MLVSVYIVLILGKSQKILWKILTSKSNPEKVKYHRPLDSYFYYLIPRKSLTGTRAIEIVAGSTLQVLPNVREPMLRFRRPWRWLLAFLLVRNKAARTRLIWDPLPCSHIPSMFIVRFTSIARAIEMFRDEKGMVLMMVVEEAFDVWGIEEREIRA